jgi:hypothetical protein
MKKVLTCLTLLTSLGAKANIDMGDFKIKNKNDSVYFGIGHISSARTVRHSGVNIASSNSGNAENYNLILGTRTKYYGIELDRKQLEGFSIGTSKGETSLGDGGLYSLKAIGYLPVYSFSQGQRIEAFAGFGYAYAPSLVMGNASKHSYAPVFSAGLEARVHENLSLRFGYDYYSHLNANLKDFAPAHANLGVTSFSVLLHL